MKNTLINKAFGGMNYSKITVYSIGICDECGLKGRFLDIISPAYEGRKFCNCKRCGSNKFATFAKESHRAY